MDVTLLSQQSHRLKILIPRHRSRCNGPKNIHSKTQSCCVWLRKTGGGTSCDTRSCLCTCNGCKMQCNESMRTQTGTRPHAVRVAFKSLGSALASKGVSQIFKLFFLFIFFLFKQQVLKARQQIILLLFAFPPRPSLAVVWPRHSTIRPGTLISSTHSNLLLLQFQFQHYHSTADLEEVVVVLSPPLVSNTGLPFPSDTLGRHRGAPVGDISPEFPQKAVEEQDREPF